MPSTCLPSWRCSESPRWGAFYERLVEQGKPKMVAVVAVMRKLLLAVYGMPTHDADCDGALCF